MNYVPVIGLEIHAELKTRTKLFCDSANDPNETRPNVNICPICMGHPGTLPVLNEQAVRHVVKTGLALRSEINQFTKWDRKNYFYPDLPKGYQISQYDMPLCKGGWLEIEDAKRKAQSAKRETETRRIHIRRIHLEEDTGRLMHPEGENYSLVDFNRAGVPLMELVTEPDLRSGEEARLFGQELQLALRYLGVSDADMEHGQMRVEANISVREPDQPLGIKVEIKNLNSFRVVERAVQYEIVRQTAVLESGGQIVQETRGWNEAKGETFSQRLKEEAEEYRYFPEPDLPPLEISSEQLTSIQISIPELPWAKRERLAEEYQIPEEQIGILVNDPALAEYFERSVSELKSWLQSSGIKGTELPLVAQLVVNYLTSDLLGLLQTENLRISEIRITPENFAELIKMIVKKEISSRVAKDVLLKMLHHAGEPDPSVIVQEEGLAQIGDESALTEMIQKVIQENPKAVKDFQNGKENALQFLAGQVMKATRGSANPGVAQELLKKELGG